MQDWMYLLIGAVVGWVLAQSSSDQSGKERLRRIERRTIFISEKLGWQNPTVEDEIRWLVQEGRKIEAIKVYRDHSRCGLAEAKDYVDSIEQSLRLVQLPLDG